MYIFFGIIGWKQHWTTLLDTGLDLHGLDWHTNNSYWIQKIPNFATSDINIWFLRQRIVWLREIRLHCITYFLTDNSRKSSYFSHINSILFSKTECLNEINISFAGYSIKQHGTLENHGCQLDSKLSDETLASKILGK